MNDAVLRIDGLYKNYGALTVTDGVQLDLQRGELHALIGPNGAGKTTLINQIAGHVKPDAGHIWFEGVEVTAFPLHRRAKSGMARSFQRTTIFQTFTVEGNVAVAVQGRQSHSFRFWHNAARLSRLVEPARAVLQQVGLAARAGSAAATLSHGESRQLELGLALASGPSVLLLDEPTAGLGRDESRGMVDFLRRLKGQYSILLIEHDMDAVFALADRVSVLAAGRVIATGTPDQIRSDPEVRAAYLGTDEI